MNLAFIQASAVENGRDDQFMYKNADMYKSKFASYIQSY